MPGAVEGGHLVEPQLGDLGGLRHLAAGRRRRRLASPAARHGLAGGVGGQRRALKASVSGLANIACIWPTIICSIARVDLVDAHVLEGLGHLGVDLPPVSRASTSWISGGRPRRAGRDGSSDPSAARSSGSSRLVGLVWGHADGRAQLLLGGPERMASSLDNHAEATVSSPRAGRGAVRSRRSAIDVAVDRHRRPGGALRCAPSLVTAAAGAPPPRSRVGLDEARIGTVVAVGAEAPAVMVDLPPRRPR